MAMNLIAAAVFFVLGLRSLVYFVVGMLSYTKTGNLNTYAPTSIPLFFGGFFFFF